MVDINPEARERPGFSGGSALVGGWAGTMAGVTIVNKGRIPLGPKESDSIKVMPISKNFQPTKAEGAGILAGSALVGALVLASLVYGVRRFRAWHRDLA